MAKFYATTPIYYVNAAPHIGSAYTTIAADVFTRFRAQEGDETFLLTGTAEHGTKIAEAASKQDASPQDFTDTIAEKFVDAWKQLDISYDDFIRTTEKRHADSVESFFKALKESGKIYEGEYEGLYCVGHEAFMKEDELDENGNCPDHNEEPELIREQNWFFKLSDFTEELQKKIESNELLIEPESARNKILSFLDEGLEDISVSRQHVDWALPLPWDEKQTIYVWLDELFNYCSAIGYGKDEKTFRRLWPADVHFVGKDIIKFHCIIWPALLMAIDEPIPHRVVANGFFTVDGQKISKSLGNAIDPNELVEEYGADAIRYFLLREIPFGSDGNFSHERLRERYNADLANGLGNFASRTLNMFEKFWPDFSAEENTDLPLEVDEYFSASREHMNNMEFDKALASIWDAIAWADQKIEETKPWELSKSESNREDLEHILQQLYAVLVHVNTAIAAFMPQTHNELTKLLTADSIKKPDNPLFERK